MTAAFRVMATVLLPILFGCSAARADTGGSDKLILPTDPRFNVLELANSVGGGSFTSPVGTVLMSFVSKDRRYCRTARFPADQNVLLACREEGGWKVEAQSDFSRAEANYPTSFGGGSMREISAGIESLMASIKPLEELAVIEAASKG